jgi:hypothetical protein
MRRTLRLDGSDIEVLRVPFMYQAEKDFLCVPFSLLMCVIYFNNIYNNSVVRKNTPNMNIDDIIKITKTRNLGTIVNTALINRLNSSINSLQFEFRKSCNTKDLEKKFNENIPSIVLYDSSYLLYDKPGSNHAGVVIGIVDNTLILNNPWQGPNWLVDVTEFERSWELEGNRAILINPKNQESLGAYDQISAK